MRRSCKPVNAVRIRASAPTSVAVAEGLRHWIVAPVMRVRVPPVTPGVGVLGVLTALAMRNADRFDADTLHQFQGTLAHMGEHPPCKRERSVQLR